MLEEVNPNEVRRNQVYPYDKKYLKNSGDQTDKLDHSLYSMNVLNLEGKWQVCNSGFCRLFNKQKP